MTAACSAQRLSSSNVIGKTGVVDSSSGGAAHPYISTDEMSVTDR
jgi:hypothetical protein